MSCTDVRRGDVDDVIAVPTTIRSGDSDQAEFDGYFAEMPWCALPYTHREFRDDLEKLYDVEGIPTLVLLDGTGGLLTSDGREAIDLGIEFFPWDEASMEAAAAAEEEKAAARAATALETERVLAAAIKAKGWLAMQRIRGDPGFSTMTVTNQITFAGEFDSYGCPGAAANAGKCYYEVEVDAFDGAVPQMGWADTGWELGVEGHYDIGVDDDAGTEGVGDDKHSWGIDGARSMKWHGEETGTWGAAWKQGDVIGFAADLGAKTLSFSINGVWTDGSKQIANPAFTGVSIPDPGRLYPALTAAGGTYSVNLGDGGAFKFAAPDPSYKSVADNYKPKC